MDWWKLFSGTFILIFLAELGDKTQLAAMAKTADCPDSSTAKWIVFLAASLALAASTFIAVFMGQTLKALVPDERYIKIAAGILFLIFGFMILREVYASYQTRAVPETAAASSPPVEPGLVGGITLRAALEFEALTIRRYRLLAATASPEQAKVLLALAGEDEEHLKTLRGLPGRSDGTRPGMGSERPVVAPERSAAP